MKVLVDADACPVVNLAVELAKKNSLEIHLFFDTTHNIVSDYASTHICDKGNDSVDYFLLGYCNAHDLVVTQDYGLASLVLSKGGYALNQNGMEYSEENINTLLQTRYIGQKMRKSGLRTKGPSKRTKDNDLAFIRTFNNIINRNLR